MIEQRGFIVVGFPTILIGGGGNVGSIITQCEVAFTPRYLVVPKSVALDFSILDFLIGKHSQFCGPGAEIPAEIFAGEAEGLDLARDRECFLAKAQLDHPIPLRLPACRVGEVLVLRVRNINASARVFKAVVFGTLIE